MADCGFIIKDQLLAIRVNLNIPPFMDKRKQLPANEVRMGQKIDSLWIHIKHVIGRIKNYAILKGTIKLFVCAWLVSFQSVLIPPVTESEVSVEEYLKSYYTIDSDYDGDTEKLKVQVIRIFISKLICKSR